MYSETDLQSAVAAGAITPEAADALRSHISALRNAPLADEEQFRLITSFNDIFVSIAAILFLVGCAWAGGSFAPWLGAALVTISAWGMAEFFTARRRMALPSILLLMAFVGGSFATTLLILIPQGYVDGSNRTGMALAALSAAISAGSAWLHWRRFHVPITIAAGVGAITGVGPSLLAAALPVFDSHILYPALLIAGLLIFGFAMYWDLSDRDRKTRRADVAFWLHLLAAPMIVHPIFAMLGITRGDASPAVAALVLAIYLALGAVALVIDRRALMVSALAYVLAAMGTLFREFGAVSLNVAITALLIGSALLLLSAFWHNVRAYLVALLPEGMQSRLPPAANLIPQPAS
jgi:MFS family permease